MKPIARLWPATVWLLSLTAASAHAQLVAEPSAVQLSLDWLARRQQDDGSWPAAHRRGRDSKLTLTANHATGLVLLAYLGAGQTRRDGQYKRNVARGIEYLVRQMKANDDLGDLRGDGDLQAHAVAALALCELYAMTNDRELIVPAQLAVRFTERSQNRDAGGWGRQPGQRGDMHVTGWQLLTIRSGWMGNLLVRDDTLPRLSKFLDGRQIDDGRYYGRVMREQDPQSTAIGLLARAQADWRRDDDRWRDGVDWLVNKGPALHDVQRNFWVAQVARHADAETWAKWNNKFRDQIVDRQDRGGEQRGSWWDDEDVHADRGRIYQTALNTLCLEIYYRHLLVFRDAWPGDDEEDEAKDTKDAATDEDPFGDPFGE